MEGSSSTNVSNFVSVKLSPNFRNYLLWKAQMLCLLDSHNMCGIVDPTYVGPKHCTSETMRRYDSLVKGWIFGSVSEDVLVEVYNLDSAKAVWEKLKFMSLQQAASDSAATKSDVQGTISSKNEDHISIVLDQHKTETKNEDMERRNKLNKLKGKFREAAISKSIPAMKSMFNEMQDREQQEAMEQFMRENFTNIIARTGWAQLERMFQDLNSLGTMEVRGDGSTLLHVTVGIGNNDVVKNLLRSYIDENQVLKKRNSDGSTALHVAAIVGNKYATELLVKKNSELLRIEDDQGKQPLHRACENMHLDITAYLWKAITDEGKSSSTDAFLGVEIGDLITNAISAKNYNLASELVKHFPNFASKNDDVLMAAARTYPIGLNDAESFVYPILAPTCFSVVSLAIYLLSRLVMIIHQIYSQFLIKGQQRKVAVRIFNVFGAVPMMLLWVFELIILFIMISYYLFLLCYYLLWKAAKILGVPPITHIEKKKKEWDDAEKMIVLVCNQIDDERHYIRPIHEAARHNAYKVVEEIIFRAPEASQSTNESGHDVFQIAIMNRSQNTYNYLNTIIADNRNGYRTRVDCFNNNILHLAARLAPSREFNHRTGAALQLQQELQWFEEAKKLVFPTYITKENIDEDTPNMVFTREHRNLLQEAEQWMKTTSESCSITAALITTIVFAAAITVPGGSNQEKGTPVFRKEIAFTIFAISDAISLFASSTALLVFLSILTARFGENNFLVSLPRRLLIGLFTLLLSTIAMMVAFTSTLFLVFCDKKSWMLAPICGLAFVPIAFFVTLQFPLMIDLFRSTEMRKFREPGHSVPLDLVTMVTFMDTWVWHKCVRT